MVPPTRRLVRTAFAVGMLIMLAGCSGGSAVDGGSDGDGGGEVGEGAPAVSVPEDRSLDVAYVGGAFELSFEPVDQQRAMWARVLEPRVDEGDDGWVEFGVLRTGEANEPGELVVAPLDGIAVLDGVSSAAAPDVYRAPDVSAGRYLVCAELVPPPQERPVSPDDVVAVCGEVTVD